MNEQIKNNNARVVGLFFGGCFAALLLVLLGVGFGWYARGKKELAGERTEKSLVANPVSQLAVFDKQPLYVWQGRKVFKRDLPVDLAAKLGDVAIRYAKSNYEANYNLYRESYRLVQSHIVSSLVKETSSLEKVTTQEAERKLLPTDVASDEDAFQLFQASDPSGSKKDFVKVRDQLLAYIAEVGKREAAETLLTGYKDAKQFSFLMDPPHPVLPNFELAGFPFVGSSDAKFSVVNFTDFMCRKCPQYNMKLAELMNKSGLNVKFVFVPFPFSRPDRGVGISRGALCAHEQKAYLDYHMKLVSLGEFVVKANPDDIAKSAGLDLDQFRQCYAQGTGVAELLARAELYAKEFGVLQTPFSYAANAAFLGEDELPKLYGEIEKRKN